MINNKYYKEDLEKITNFNLPYEKLNNKKILITGANGLIASYVVDSLMYLNLFKNYNVEVFALCRTKEKAEKRFQEYLNNENFNLILQDVCTPLNTNINFDYIIHAACNAHPLAYSQNPVGVINSNIVGTTNLLNYILKYKAERFMFISSSEVYGNNFEVKEFFEDSFGKIDSMNPRSCYSESKRMAETICASYASQYGLDFVSVRPGFIYGATITEDNSRADAQFLRNVLNGEDIVMKSKGEQIRSYCYVADCVTAIFTILLKGKNGEAYNISDNKIKVSIKEFAETLAKEGKVKLKFELPNEVEKKGYSVIDNAVLNSDKLEKLGWQGQYSLEKGMQQTLKILMKGII